MGSSLCKPRSKKRIMTSSWIRLNDPKEVIGQIFVDIVSDLCPELKKVFGADRAPKVTMLKMPKLGGHVSRMADFFEQLTSMVGFTENLVGAWQLVRKTGRLHAKVPFLESNQNQLEKNYLAIVIDTFIEQMIPFLTGVQKESTSTSSEGTDADAEKKKVRFAQNYSPVFVADVWRRFLNVICAQLTESFEFERQKCLNSNNQQTLAPHQHAEELERKKRLNAERQSEIENFVIQPEKQKEEMFEDPF